MEMYETYKDSLQEDVTELGEDRAVMCPRCHKKTLYPEIGVCTTDEEYDRWNE